MNNHFSLTVTADLNNLTDIYRFVEQTAATLGLESSVIYEVKLAVDEAATNIIVHGYKDQGGNIEIEISQKEDALIVQLRDEAVPFDPTSVPPPDLTKPLTERAIGGLGVYLMQQTMDEVNYGVTSSGGNELTLIKRCVGKK